MHCIYDIKFLCLKFPTHIISNLCGTVLRNVFASTRCASRRNIFQTNNVVQRYAPMWQDYKIGVIRRIFYSLRFDSIAERDAIEAVGLFEGRRKLTESKDAFRTSGDVRRRRRHSRQCQRC